MSDAGRPPRERRPGGNAEAGFDPTRLAAQLIDAHRTGRPCDPPSATDAPANHERAYEIQAKVAAGLGEEIAGWKAALTPHGPVMAPIFRRLVSASDSIRRTPSNSPTGIEIELAIWLRPDTIAGASDIADTAHELFIGIELIGGRFNLATEVPFTAFLADNLGNSGYVIGEQIFSRPAIEITDAPLRVVVDGRVMFEGPARHPNGDPLAPLKACSGLARGLGGFRPGQFVTLGSICGVIDVNRPSRIEASISGWGGVACAFEPSQ